MVITGNKAVIIIIIIETVAELEVVKFLEFLYMVF